MLNKFVRLVLDASGGVVTLKGVFTLDESAQVFIGRTDEGEGVVVPMMSVLYAVRA